MKRCKLDLNENITNFGHRTLDFGPAAIRFWVGKYIDYGMRDAGYGINFPSSTAAAVYVVYAMSNAICIRYIRAYSS